MPVVETVGIIAKPNAARAAGLVPELLRWLDARGIRVRMDEVSAGYAGSGPGMPREQVPEGCQLVIVLGGDGTLLAAARAVGGREVQVLGVNLGGLGFLAAVQVEELYPLLEDALRGDLRIGLRRMLHCELSREGRTVAGYEALNDVVLSKASIARMIDLETHVDGQLVCVYKSDGLIVATPTGSTAYSLSAGGPIVFPSVDCIGLTPISSHTLTNRPVIVPARSVIRIRSRAADGEVYLTIDGQVGEPLRRDDVVVCRSSEHAVRLVRPRELRFFDVLREKLKWGTR
ncbi:MAG: NAD(+)/NADH kinase [Bryobacterales bacterium]|nr:NAD(+)/NADH kinase [Bryobacterales bacterium]